MMLVMFASSISASGAWAQSPNPDLQVAAIQYNQGALPQGLQQYLPETLGTRFQWIGSGIADVSGYNIWWSDYMDSGGLLVPMVYAYAHDVAAAKGWNYESMFLHFNQDYAVPGGAVGPTTWYNMDCFDVWEQPRGSLNQGIGACATAINGALIYNGSAYRDVTPQLYAASCNPACQIANGDTLYLGYAEPFALININLSIPRVGGTAAWQYWNGSSWATLTPTSDTTSGLTANGTINFSPPVAWAPTIVNGSQSKYWVRLNITNNPTTAPTLVKVWGDDWISHATNSSCNGACDSRGWNAATCQSTLVTLSNGIQFCAVPSATATAQFRYQGRATGYWNHNYLFINPADSQGGQLTFVAALIARWAAQRSPGAGGPSNPNALMLDNVGEHPQPAYPAWSENLTDVPCSQSCTSGAWQNYVNALMPAVASGLKNTYPALVAVGGNDSTDIYKSVFDFNVWELGGSSWVIGNWIYGGFNTEFDNWLPANNPTGSKAVIAIWDNQHFNFCLSQAAQTCHLWDGGNRTPMLVLASYYFGSNQNTMMLYNTQGWSYWDTAEFYPFSPITSTLSSALSANLSGGTINVADASQFTTVGGPVYTNNYVLRIGGQDVLKGTKSGNTFTTTGPIVNSYPAGTKVEFAQVAYWADPNHPTPNSAEMWYYANWFPAMWVDIGTPDPNGWNGGARDLTYLTGTASSGLSSCPSTGYTCAETWRIDYTNAIILAHTIHDNTLEQEIDTYGPAINLVDPSEKLYGPYYRLNSDGTTGPAITSIQLRGAEAAILMKNPVGSFGPPPLQTSFTFTPTEPAVNKSVQFTDTSTGSPTAWSWNFGDTASGQDNTSKQQNPIHIYAASGNYTVTLTVGNGSINGGGHASNMVTVSSGSGGSGGATKSGGGALDWISLLMLLGMVCYPCLLKMRKFFLAIGLFQTAT